MAASVDRFTNNFNLKEGKYNSKYYCLGASHFNAFTDKWIDEENWLCPLVSYIVSIIRHL